MGEYANRRPDGARVKIGTCEDMLYLRDDQRGQVYGGDLGSGRGYLRDPDVLASLRFRFPWPDEDGTLPGDFEPFRSLRLDGMPVPAGVEHGSTQFTATYPKNGYLLSLPCPEGPDADPRIARNGYGGALKLTAQGWRGGRLVGIAECGGCGHAFRLEDGYALEAEMALREMGAERLRDMDRWNLTAEARGQERITGDNGAAFYLTIADRLREGYARSLAEAVA
jgi:hypothetical protein